MAGKGVGGRHRGWLSGIGVVWQALGMDGRHKGWMAGIRDGLQA